MLILILAAVAAASYFLLEFSTRYLWFDSLGHTPLLVEMLSTQLFMGISVGLGVGLFFLFNALLTARRIGNIVEMLPANLENSLVGRLLAPDAIRKTAFGAAAVLGFLMGSNAASKWELWALFSAGENFGAGEPIFGLDAGFYVFTLPFLEWMHSVVWGGSLLTLVVVSTLYFMASNPAQTPSQFRSLSDFLPFRNLDKPSRTHIAGLMAWLLALHAVSLYLQRYAMMHSNDGLFSGPGYADIYANLPLLMVRAVITVAAAVVIPWGVMMLKNRVLIGAALVLIVTGLGGSLYAGVLQRFVVLPNELERERPFLSYHIDSTNQAFGLSDIKERQLTQETRLTMGDIKNNAPTINNIRLWDHEPLLDTFSQIQEIRTYYDFVSVDNDRYLIDGELRQTMLSPRELNAASLPSRTWVNERLTFTHGYGVTVGPVNQVNEQGLPTLFVQDLPPQSSKSVFDITNPQIYYGELPADYIFTNTTQSEFDYPEGEKNVFYQYDGKGGVLLDSWWKRFIFAIHLRDFKMLLSDDITTQSRVMIHRNILERVKELAPFLTYDSDPYLVVTDKRLVWVYDAYTTSTRYPYSRRVGWGNYMRNPVKVVIDAKDGSVQFYLAQPNEPIAKAYAKFFAGVMRPLSDMPEDTRSHLRHPTDYFSVQTDIYATYHMRGVNTFYNKEDQWSVPVVGKKRMEPYYTVMKLPGETKEEFILMLPFTPRLKDNLAAWMVARSDGENYGELVVYKFPKQKLVFGPKQMAARINQDARVSQQITLWDQSGSSVIRGTLLVIPIENALLYVQPLYLKAEDGRIPELKRVIVGYETEIAMGTDLDDALSQIFSGSSSVASTGKTSKVTKPSSSGGAANRWLKQAMDRYKSLEAAARQGDWVRFGERMRQLKSSLERGIQTMRAQ